jgi:hypothetical protein
MYYFKLNHDAIIFLDSDAEYGYKTIAYDDKDDKIFEISPPIYFILKALDKAGSVNETDLEKLLKNFSLNDNSIKKAVDELINKGVIIKNEY